MASVHEFGFHDVFFQFLCCLKASLCAVASSDWSTRSCHKMGWSTSTGSFLLGIKTWRFQEALTWKAVITWLWSEPHPELNKFIHFLLLNNENKPSFSYYFHLGLVWIEWFAFFQLSFPHLDARGRRYTWFSWGHVFPYFGSNLLDDPWNDLLQTDDSVSNFRGLHRIRDRERMQGCEGRWASRE